MRVAIILCVLALTGAVFFTATQTLPTTDSTAQIKSLQAEITTAREALDSQTTELSEKVAALEAQNTEQSNAFAADRETLEADLAQAQQSMQDTEAEIARLEGLSSDVADLSNQIATLTESNATLSAENDVFAEQNATLTRDASAMTETLASLQLELQGATDEAGTVDAALATLNVDLDAARAEAETLRAKIIDLEAAQADTLDYVADLEAAATTATTIPNTEIAALQSSLGEKTEALAEAETRLAALIAAEADTAEASAAFESQMAAYETQVATLTAAVVERDEKIEKLRTIATLQASVAASAPEATPVATCQERSDAVLTNASIGFASGLTSITPDSVQVLEDLAVIAADCVGQDLTLDIEGHTDNVGGGASNLLLSNGRAKAVHDFFIERGVPTASVRAVGFGANNPIADNATEEGRAQNRRIVLDWDQS